MKDLAKKIQEANDGKIPVYVKLPKALRDRTDKLLKKYGMTWNTLVKDACIDFIEQVRKK